MITKRWLERIIASCSFFGAWIMKKGPLNLLGHYLDIKEGTKMIKPFLQHIPETLWFIVFIVVGVSLLIDSFTNYSNKKIFPIIKRFYYRLKFPNKPVPIKDINSEDFKTELLSGKVEIFYENNDGNHTFGHDQYLFETKWGGCSINSVRLYKGKNTTNPALVDYTENPHEVKNASLLDFSSSCRGASKEQLVLTVNENGYYILFKILEVHRSNIETKEKVLINFWIQPDGSDDFSKLFKKVIEEKYFLK